MDRGTPLSTQKARRRKRAVEGFEGEVRRISPPQDPFAVALGGARLGRSVLDLWRALPAEARDGLLHGWLSRSPLVVTIPGLIEDHHVVGRYQHHTGAIVFDRRAIEVLPDEALRALVCHELIHALRFSTGSNHPCEDKEEDATLGICAALGFTWARGLRSRRPQVRILSGAPSAAARIQQPGELWRMAH